MARSNLWLPWTTGSNTTSADTQGGQIVDGEYLTGVGAEFKGTIIAVKGSFAIQQDAPSNALERFSVGLRVRTKGVEVTLPDLFTDISNKWFWRMDGFIGGPGGDSTALVNVMSAFVFPIDGRSKRKVGFNEEIVFNFKTTAIAKLGAAGRFLLLEA